VTLSAASSLPQEEITTQDNSIFSFFNYFWQRGKEITRIQKETIEKAAHQLWGEFRLHLLGFYPETNERATIGKGEVSEKVRLTVINGILNQKKDWQELIQCISQSHGNVNVHSVYWPSEGWTKDVYKGLMANSGHLSDAVKDLVILWRSLIEEMGGIDSDCLIIHYAHSIGAVETNVAKQLLTPAEMQKIKVCTFGTPHLYPNTDYLDVTHYISQRDGVIFLKPLAYFAAITDPNYKIVLIGDDKGPPLIDHFINFGTYHDKILDLGAEFESTYGSVPYN
jgi:hypothetical protein